jgi:hypothetical protein
VPPQPAALRIYATHAPTLQLTVSDVGASNLREMFPSALRFELHGLYLYRIDRGHIIEGGALFDDLPLLQLALESVARSA